MLLVKVFSTTRPSVSMSKMADTEALDEIGFPMVTIMKTLMKIMNNVSMSKMADTEALKEIGFPIVTRDT